jgi:hypothetical protein
MDAVPFHEDVGFHFRIPTAGEVTKMGTGSEKICEFYAGHDKPYV